MLALVCLTCLAGFFALRMDSDPESCLATDESDTLFVRGSEVKYTDVGAKFRLVFELIFYTNVAQICLLSLNYMVSSAKFSQMLDKIVNAGSYVTFCAWFYGLYLRLTHLGKVCSGDYLNSHTN
jgi:hypothetical protein